MTSYLTVLLLEQDKKTIRNRFKTPKEQNVVKIIVKEVPNFKYNKDEYGTNISKAKALSK